MRKFLPSALILLLAQQAALAQLKPLRITHEDMREKSWFQDEYVVNSNLWGAQAMKNRVPPFVFTIMRPEHNALIGFSYNWKISAPFDAPIFPYIGYGDRMWETEPESTTTRLPIRVDAIESCDIHYRVKIDEASFRQAMGNLAVDVWLGERDRANDDGMRTEIMLWFDRNNQYPVGGNNHQGAHTFAGATWDLYIGDLTPNGTKVCTFIAQKPVYGGVIDFLQPLNIVRAKGHVRNSDYLGGFELGNEVYRGNGSTAIKQFHIDLQPRGVPKAAISGAWRFNDQAFGKRWFDGKQGMDVKAPMSEHVRARSISVRFRAVSTKERQVLYKDGDQIGGRCIYLEDSKIHFLAWHTENEQREMAHLEAPVPQIERRKDWRGAPVDYVQAALVLDAKTKQLTGFVNGELIGRRVLGGLPKTSVPTTIGYSDKALPFPGSEPSTGNHYRGHIDEVLVFNRALNVDQITHLR